MSNPHNAASFSSGSYLGTMYRVLKGHRIVLIMLQWAPKTYWYFLNIKQTIIH